MRSWRAGFGILWISLALVVSSCSDTVTAPSTSTVPPTTTTTAVPVELDRIVRYDLRLDEGETQLRTTLAGGPGESIVLLGDGTDLAPTMRLLDESGAELATGTVDQTFTDLADLAYQFTSADPITLEMDSTDGQRFRLRIDASVGVVPTLSDGSRAQLPTAGEYRYLADGDVLIISTSAVLEGSVVLERVDGSGRYSRSAVELVGFPAARWFTPPGTYRVAVAGRVGSVSIASRTTGLRSATDTAGACAVFESIQQRQLDVGGALAPISGLIEESLSGGTLDDAWLEQLKDAVEDAEPALDALDGQFREAQRVLPPFFGQDLTDMANGIRSSWLRLGDSAAEAVSPRQFFELIASANDARLLRIGETAGYSLTNLDAFTTQVCGFSIRTAEIGIQA